MNSDPADWKRLHQQLADAIEVMPEGFALFDAEDRYVMWNERYAEIYAPVRELIVVGARFEDVVRSALAKGLILDAVGREEEWLANRLAEHRRDSRCHEHHMQDDKWVRANDRCTADGGRVSTRTDITELKRAEVQIREQKLQTDTALNNMVQGLIMFDAEGRVVLRNQRYLDMYGLSPDVVKIGCSHRELITHRKELGVFVGDPDSHCQRNLARVALGKPWNYVFEFPNGRRTIQAVHHPMPGGGWVSTHEDITGRQWADLKIREQKQQIDTAVNHMTQALVMFDAESRLVLWNQQYVDMYGVSPDVMKEGCTHLELVKHKRELGLFAGDPESHSQWNLARAAEGKPWSSVSEFPDGRSIQKVLRPMPGGGWVSTHEDITERKNAETQIHRLASIVETSKDEVYVFDGETFKFLQVNVSACENLGYTKQELTELTPADLKPEYTPDMFERLVAPLRTGEKYYVQFETLHRRKDGSLYDVDVTIQHIGSADRPVFSADIEDITERKQAEAKNRQQKLQLDAAVDNMVQGLVMFDANERVILVNQRYIDIYDLSPNIVRPGCTFLELIQHRQEKGGFSSDAEARRQQALAHVAAGETWSSTRKLPDGRSVHGVHLPLADGSWVSTHEDITDRQEAQAKLGEQKLQLDTALDNLVQGLAMFDADGRLVLWNQRFVDMYGMSPDIVKAGCSHLELLKHRRELGVLPDDLDALRQEHLAHAADGKPWSRVLELPDGRSIHVAHRHLPDGSRVSTHEDITERRQAEAKIREQKLQLDAAVDNMVQGLVMFNADGRVVLWNQRYIEIHNLPPDALREGCTFLELMKSREEVGTISGDAETNCQRVMDRLAEGTPWSFVHDLGSGRSVQTTNHPMPDGGWVSTHEDITERQDAEAKNREQKLQIDAAVGNMAQGLVMYDSDGRLVLWNQRYIDMYDLSPDVVKVGCSYLELMKHKREVGVFSGDPNAHCQNVLMRVAAGDSWSRVVELPNNRGTIQVAHRPLPNGGWVSTHEDITERQRAEGKVHEQKQQLDAAIDNILQGLVMFDADERVVLVNQRYIDMYDFSPSVVKPGCTHLEIIEHRKELGIFVGDPETERQRRLAQLAKAKPWNFVHTLPDGRSIETSQRPLPDGGWVSTHEDITERQRAEIKIREQKLQLNTAVDNMSQGLAMFDADGRLAVVNQRYIHMYGLSPSVIREGCSLYTLMKHREDVGAIPGDAEANCQRVFSRVAKGKPFGVVHDLPDGRSIQTVNSPLPDGGWVSTHEDITERRESQKKIEHLAHHDVLTGLSNRGAFNQFLSTALDNASQLERQLAILCIDLDRLKNINDVFGHAAGDELLKKVAERLTEAANGAFVARLGGDEFSIIITGENQPESAAILAQRLLIDLAEEVNANGNLVQSNSSIGIAIYPQDGSDAATLLTNGDAALYRAKRDGRGCICFFDAEMDKELRERHVLQHELRSAVESDALKLFYQPQARTNGEITGFEALARWQHPERGMIAPEVFIPLAEDNGLVIQLGERILREACREAATWNQDLVVAVNLSPVQFKHGDLPTLVHTVLLETGLAPQRLELEITEGVLVDDFTRALSILRRLKTLGVKIAMDDFGTGFSSLSYLHAFPFDKIKIDRSFVAQLDENPRASTIIRTIISLAHGLALPAVAEGVETKKQLKFLEDEGCDEVQGFLIGLPSAIDDYAGVVGKAPTQSRGQASQAV